MNDLGGEKRQGYLNIVKYLFFCMPKTAFISILIVVCCVIFQSYFSETELRVICIGCILICGYEILIGAVKAVSRKIFFHPDVYLSVAIIGTFAIGMYYEAIIAAAVFALCRAVIAVLNEWMEHKYHTDSLNSDVLSGRKSNIQRRLSNAITAFSIIAIIAIIVLSVLIPVFWRVPFAAWLRRAFILFAAACPGALAMTAAVEYYKCINTACAQGIFFSSKDSIETAAKVTSIAVSNVQLDNPSKYIIESAEPIGITGEMLMMLGAYTCRFCDDEKSASVVRYCGIEADLSKVDMYKTIPGFGAAISLGGVKVFAGNLDLMNRIGIDTGENTFDDMQIFIAVEKKYVGKFRLKKAGDSAYAETFKKLHDTDIDRIIMLTSSDKDEAAKTAEKLNINEFWAEMDFDMQFEKLENLRKMQLENEYIAFIAEDFAEADLMKAADMGISVGVISDDSADIHIPDGVLSKSADALKLARTFMADFRFNIIFTCILKFLVIFLAVIGFAGIWSVAVIDTVASAVVLYDKKNTQYR